VQFVERFDSRQSIEDAKQLATVADGATPLLFFAEGTFTRRPGLRAFRLGAFQVAAKLGLPVVPVVLAGTREALPDGVWRLRRTTLKVTIGPPVMPEGEGWHGVLALRERTREEILRHCGERLAAD
jgi:1-acyl-sn-glycerol-3-phosphate acyltransferase